MGWAGDYNTRHLAEMGRREPLGRPPLESIVLLERGERTSDRWNVGWLHGRCAMAK